MKAYVITTGVVFALLTLMHIARMFADGARVATDPFFIIMTVAAAALTFWAWRVLKVSSRS
jgi:hypothetical protein